MAKPQISTITRQLSLSETLASVADKRAARLGISTPEYLRHLIVQDNQSTLGKPERISEPAEVQLLADIVEFIEAEQKHPSPEARSAAELVNQLDQV